MRKRTCNKSVTLRIDESYLERLDAESKKNLISLNTLINQIFRQHLDWHSLASQSGMISFPRGLIRMSLNRLPEDEIVKFVREQELKNYIEIILLLRREVTLASFLDVLVTWTSISNFPYSYSSDGKTHLFVMQHDMGKRFSTYLSELFGSMCKELELGKPEIRITENTVTFKTEMKAAALQNR